MLPMTLLEGKRDVTLTAIRAQYAVTRSWTYFFPSFAGGTWLNTKQSALTRRQPTCLEGSWA